MKLVAISDTHGRHREVVLPPGDVLVHAGDITRNGEFDTIVDFADWMASQPHAHKIAIGGNHDACLDISQTKFDGSARRALEDRGIHYLLDASRTLDGVKFYGSPWVPNLATWAFYDRNRDQFEDAPKDIDILITHSPPFAIRDGTMVRMATDPPDLTPDSRGHVHVGSKFIRRYVERCPRLRLHIFGHVHEMYGDEWRGGMHFVNACTCTRAYEPTNAPFVINWPFQAPDESKP